MLTIHPADIERHYAALETIGNLGPTPADGFNRPGWSDAESRAFDYIETAAMQAGLAVRRDGVGNLIVETPGSFDRWVECGSHLDTVQAGGNFDGAAGVVAGLVVLEEAHRAKVKLAAGLRLRLWRCEESATFGVASAGSLAATGRLDPKYLDSSYRGQRLAEAISTQGGDPEWIKRQQPTLSAAELAGIVAHFELHIEQGGLLEQSNSQIGVVTAIRGSDRGWVYLHGAFDHSGATPMGAPRRDVNLALGHILVRLDGLLAQWNREGSDLVQTIGLINCHPPLNGPQSAIWRNAISKVSGYGYFSHEVRGCDADIVAAFVAKARDLIRATAQEFAVEATIEPLATLAGVATLDDGLQKLLGKLCREGGFRWLSLPSGAWHDAATLATTKRCDGTPVPVAMIFIPCRHGISHSPQEWVSSGEIAVGATLLAAALLRLAQNAE